MRNYTKSTLFGLAIAAAGITAMFLTTDAVPSRESVEIDCGTSGTYYISTGVMGITTLTELPDGSWELWDTAGNSALVDCAKDSPCREIWYSGSCHDAPFEPNAATDISCPGGNTFDISTGTDTGDCNTEEDTQGNTTGGNCTDGGKTVSSADCSKNGGSGACGKSSGSGDCDCQTCK